MDDSFSRLAKQIRQNKINKNEIKKIKREIIDGKVFNIIKNDMAIIIQKHIRGYIYRKKYKIFLDRINTEIIIDYLYEKKLARIKSDYKNIISMNIFNYIEYIRSEKEKINLKKINSIDLIKAHMRGIIFRKNFKKQSSSLNDKKIKIEKYILSYKIKLILRSNNIQSLLIDIANIKYSLNNLEKSNDTSNTQKIKELKTKLNKNINLFYFTFYQMKENSNWISQAKISEPWLKKYLSIINKNKNIFVKKKSIYSNQKKIKRLKENNKNNENKKDLRRSDDYLSNSRNNTINNEKDIVISNFETEKNNVNSNKKYLLSEGREKDDKSYNFNFYDSESDESNNNNDINKNKKLNSNSYLKNDNNNTNYIKEIYNKNNPVKDENESKSQNQNSNENNDKKIKCNIIKRYKSKKVESDRKLSSNKSKSSEDKESLNIKINEYKMDDSKEDNNILVEKEKNFSSIEDKDKNLNKYQQREERPIKPLTNINFFENDNPFGLKKDSNNNLTESDKNNNLVNVIPKQKSIGKRSINSTRSINRNLITYNQKTKGKKNNSMSEIEKEETSKTQEKTDLSHDEPQISNKYIDYDNRPCGGGNNLNNNIVSNISKGGFDRNERPLGGTKNIDYQAMFGEGGEFDGDPFGGAKQFEDNNKEKTNKIKHNNKVNNNATKKKPVYDARKAIEEAKLKEAKEGKKEKTSAFREFLREMKKISKEEKALHNETNNNIDDNNKKVNKNNKNNKEKIIEKKDENDLDINNKIHSENSLFEKNEKLEENRKSAKNVFDIEHKENNLQKKNKPNEKKEVALRRKLHELEKAPAPVLNIKGIKSRIECWGGNNDNKKTKTNSTVQREMPKSKDEKKSKNNKVNNQRIISNMIGNKKIKDLPVQEKNNNQSCSNSSTNIPKLNKTLEESIEKYVDKKLMQLSSQVEEIDDLFNLDKYYEEKEKKMKKYINIPYIKKDFDFIIKYTNENYEERIDKIQICYKELK